MLGLIAIQRKCYILQQVFYLRLLPCIISLIGRNSQAVSPQDITDTWLLELD